ncbi:hypothetical protein PIB30_072244 [Stylosanthes scabra]|uniref:Uncharacterized protein n=1 Tax=Stylosanthes scabra TaxID=79078 RepID=A0ABU6WQM0_9FABA|nr:hypothetical protein [Stylosanthes scabra]
MDRKRKQIMSKGKGKLIEPPTKKSPRLVVVQTSQTPVSPTFVLKPNKLVVLALAANTLTPHSKAVENIQAPITKSPKATKVGKTARMSVKPLERSDDEENPRDVGTVLRQTAKDTNVDQGDKEEEEDSEWEKEEEEEDPEEYVEEEEIPTSWSLPAPSTTASKRGDDEYNDPHR